MTTCISGEVDINVHLESEVVYNERRSECRNTYTLEPTPMHGHWNVIDDLFHTSEYRINPFKNEHVAVHSLHELQHARARCLLSNLILSLMLLPVCSPR